MTFKFPEFRFACGYFQMTQEKGVAKLAINIAVKLAL